MLYRGPEALGRSGVKIPTVRLGGKETDVAPDTAKQLGERFRNIRQALDLRADETTAQAQNKALVPLQNWLLQGATSPDIPLRATQVLMADPERPGIYKRPAVNAVLKQVSEVWESAGLNEADVQILRAMLLATWPHEQKGGGFSLVPLLDSAWMAIASRTSKDKALQDWRGQLLAPNTQAPSAPTTNKKGAKSNLTQKLSKLTVTSSKKPVETLETSASQWGSTAAANVASHAAGLFRTHEEALAGLATHLNNVTNAVVELDAGLSALSIQLNDVSNTRHQTDQANLLWWGQSRYSHTLQIPYRRLSDATERLWWMAWDSSELAQSLQVEPAASFLVETLYQVDRSIDTEKRPLARWVAEFISALRRIREHGQHTDELAMGKNLEQLAQGDPLGLPVTWARLEAMNARTAQDAIEDQLRERVGLDPLVLLDRGDWAAWVFREALLDRHLGGE